MPASIVWDRNGARLHIEREGDRLKFIIGEGVLAREVRLDSDDARAVRRYLSQWIRWVEVPDEDGAA